MNLYTNFNLFSYFEITFDYKKQKKGFFIEILPYITLEYVNLQGVHHGISII